MRIGFKIVFGFLFFSLNTFSQQKVVDLDPVTITSSLSFQKASQTGRNIIVEYQDILGAPMPGRWIMGGFNLQFSNPII